MTQLFNITYCLILTSYTININSLLLLLSSHVLQGADLLQILVKEHLPKALEGLLDVFTLEGADFKELEADALCECIAVLRSHSNSVL